MKRFRSLPWLPLGVLLLFMMVAPQRADATSIKWTLTDVIFNDGGKATGSFYYDAVSQALFGFDVTTTAGTLLITGHHFLDPNGAAPPYLKEGFAVLDLPLPKDLTGARFLALVFQTALSNTPGTIALTTSSGEGFCTSVGCEYGTYTRTVKSGSIVGKAVPEPTTLYLLGVGLVAFFFVQRKKSLNVR